MVNSETFKYLATIVNCVLLSAILFFLHSLVEVQEKYVTESLKRINTIVETTNQSILTNNKNIESVRGFVKTISEDVKKNGQEQRKKR